MIRPVMVDSAVWIDFYKGRDTAATSALRAILGERELVVADLILMEVLQGFRELREVRTAEAVFATMPCASVCGEARARRAAENYRALRAAGVTPRSAVDVLIATYCVDERTELLATDRDFALMAPHLELALYDLPLN